MACKQGQTSIHPSTDRKSAVVLAKIYRQSKDVIEIRSLRMSEKKNDRKRSSDHRLTVVDTEKGRPNTINSNVSTENVLVSNTYAYKPPYQGNTLNIQPGGIEQSRNYEGESLVPSPLFLAG